MLIFINVVGFFSNSSELEEFTSGLHEGQNNNFPCYVSVIYQMTQCLAPEGSDVNTKSQKYILKKLTIYVGIYKKPFLVSLQLMGKRFP
jgi:hypothetical protein